MSSYFITYLFDPQKRTLLNDWKISRSDLKDIYIVILLYILPSNFIGFAPASLFYIPGLIDLNLITWLLSLPLLILHRNQIKKLLNSTSGKLLIIVNVYILFRFFLSIYQGILFTEVFTIFRKTFNSPIACVAIILFFYSISTDRIVRIFRWLFILFIFNSIVYIINSSGLHILPEGRIDIENVGGITYNRTLNGFPIYFIIFQLFIIIKFLSVGNIKFLIYFLIPIFVVIFSATRSTIVVSSFLIFLTFFIYILTLNKNYIRKLKKLAIIFIIIAPVLLLFNQNTISFIIKKFDQTINVELKNNSGTYSFRENLISNSIEEISKNNTLLLGIGYKRVSEKGEYDFVLGGDTHIAPVLFCEGFAGLFIRILPILYFLYLSIFNRKKKIDFELRVFIFVIIAASILSYVQTSIFHNYLNIILFFYLIEIISEKMKNEK